MTSIEEVNVKQNYFEKFSKNVFKHWVKQKTLYPTLFQEFEMLGIHFHLKERPHREKQYTTCILKTILPNQQEFFVTIVYGCDERSPKSDLWMELKKNRNLQLLLMVQSHNSQVMFKNAGLNLKR